MNILVAYFLWYLLADKWQVGSGWEAVGYAAITIFIGGGWLSFFASKWLQINPIDKE